MTLVAARARLDQHVEVGLAGIAVVRVAPGTQRKVALALADADDRAVLALDALDPTRVSPVLVVAGLPRPRADATAALVRFNGMRDRLHATGALVVLVLDRWESAALQRHAADVWSALLFEEAVPFEPEANVAAEEARRVLVAWQRERFGRLDLRGFIRAENEDVSWRVEDIYQDLKITTVRHAIPASDDAPPFLGPGMKARPVTACLASPDERLVVVLGHPGSGKSFLLRWLALALGTSDTLLGVARPLPVLLSLAAWATAPGPVSLFEYAAESMLLDGLLSAHVLGAEAAAGRAVFLLDGLDEVGDSSTRGRVVKAIEALRTEAPRCRVLVTSRLAGFDATALPGALLLTLAAFDDDAIRGFLTRWCEMYAVDRAGDAPNIRQRGREEGEALARDVIAHPEVRGLAGNPLLLTVIAIVHRTGVRLPDHRVELYDHATKILVERWNRVRSASATHAAPPLKATDAVRLLGPVALEMIRSGTHGVIREERLRQLLDASLKDARLRGVTTPDEAIGLFRNTLGLLVEQSPEVYAFMHLTLAEYFAAWELVRTEALETLANDEGMAFRAEWREVILLALGVLGVLRGDDTRLDAVVQKLMRGASRKKGKPSPNVPSLFGGLLADNPGLSEALIEAVVKFLVPTWWFEKMYDGRGSVYEVAYEAEVLAADRIRDHHVREVLRREVARVYNDGPTERTRTSLSRHAFAAEVYLLFLNALDVDDGRSVLAFHDLLSLSKESPIWAVLRGEGGDEIVAEVDLGRWLHAEIGRGALHARVRSIYRWKDNQRVVFACDGDLSESEDMGVNSQGYQRVECRLRLADPEGFSRANEANEAWGLDVDFVRSAPVASR